MEIISSLVFIVGSNYVNKKRNVQKNNPLLFESLQIYYQLPLKSIVPQYIYICPQKDLQDRYLTLFLYFNVGGFIRHERLNAADNC